MGKISNENQSKLKIPFNFRELPLFLTDNLLKLCLSQAQAEGARFGTEITLAHSQL